MGVVRMVCVYMLYVFWVCIPCVYDVYLWVLYVCACVFVLYACICVVYVWCVFGECMCIV